MTLLFWHQPKQDCICPQKTKILARKAVKTGVISSFLRKPVGFGGYACMSFDFFFLFFFFFFLLQGLLGHG